MCRGMSFTLSFRSVAAPVVCAAGMIFAATAFAEPGFSDGLGKADFKAAGLEKLSGAERARLDALVKAYAAGDYKAAEAAAAPAPSPASAPKPPAPKKQIVKIDPGAEIEYNTMDSELAGTFAGFEKGTVFTLTNGQRWKVVDGTYVCGPDERVKKVRVKPGVLGSFFLEFEKVGVRAKAQLVK